MACAIASPTAGGSAIDQVLYRWRILVCHRHWLAQPALVPVWLASHAGKDLLIFVGHRQWFLLEPSVDVPGQRGRCEGTVS